MTLRSGELARDAGVHVETLRFYERRGLLPLPPRRPSGYRAYPREAIALVCFIRRAQDLGFSLREIKELLALRRDARAACDDVVVLARQKVEQIDSKLRDLRSMKAALTRLLADCTGSAPITGCPILEALASPTSGRKQRRAAPRVIGEGRHGEHESA